MLIKNFIKSYSINTSGKKKSYNTLSYLILNFFANFLIAIFLKFKIKPDAVTSLNLILYLTSTILIFSFQNENYFFGIIIFLITLLIDKCDGGLARIYKHKTFFGKYYDSIIDIIFPGIILLGLTLNYYIVNDDFLFLTIGIFSSFFLVFDSTVLDKYAAIVRWCNQENKSKIVPYLKKNMITNFHDILKQDIIFVCLILILLKPLSDSSQVYYFSIIYSICIYCGLYNLIFHSIKAKKNLNYKKK